MSIRIHSASRIALVLAAAAAALPAPTAAADKDDRGRDSAYVEALKNCQVQTDDAARLACFDKAVATLVAANDQGDLRVVDREAVRKTRRSLFGFSLPDFGIFGGRDADEAEEPEVLQTTIAKVRASDNAGWVIVTAEGAVWQVDNVPARLLSPKVGQSLEIRSAALSSYFLRINGQPGVRGRRIA
jgi:hypothetical protein